MNMRTYEPIRLIGRGGMGEVYEGRILFPLGLQSPCAIKLIRKDHSHDPAFQRMFAREAMSSMSVRHPNVVPAYDFGEASDGRLFLILDLIRGPTVGEALDRIDGDAATVARIAYDALLALQYLHACQFIHRDISPSNLLIDRRGRIMVGDLGVVKRGSGSGSGRFRGVEEYEAPEVRAGGGTTPASDVYRLGAVLFELLTDEPPRASRRGRARSESHLLSEDLPAGLRDVVRRMIQPDPDERLTVDDALRALEAEHRASDLALTKLADAWLDAHEDDREAGPEDQPEGTPVSMHGAVLQLSKPDPAPPRGPTGRRIILAMAGVAALSIGAGAIAVQWSQCGAEKSAPTPIAQTATEPVAESAPPVVPSPSGIAQDLTVAPGEATKPTSEQDHADVAPPDDPSLMRFDPLD